MCELSLLANIGVVLGAVLLFVLGIFAGLLHAAKCQLELDNARRRRPREMCCQEPWCAACERGDHQHCTMQASCGCRCGGKDVSVPA